MAGDLLTMYSSDITFTVYHTSSDNAMLVETKVIIIGRNGSRLEIAVPRVEPGQVTVVTVSLSEDTVTQMGKNVTRPELMLALTDVQAILLPASFSSLSHTTR